MSLEPGLPQFPQRTAFAKVLNVVNTFKLIHFHWEYKPGYSTGGNGAFNTAVSKNVLEVEASTYQRWYISNGILSGENTLWKNVSDMPFHKGFKPAKYILSIEIYAYNRCLSFPLFKCNLHSVTRTYFECTIQCLLVNVRLCNCHCSLVLEQVYYFQNNFLPICKLFPIFTTYLQASTLLLSVSAHLRVHSAHILQMESYNIWSIVPGFFHGA